MIKYKSEMRSEERPNMRGGNGTVKITHALEKEEINGPMRLCATLTLEPGASIGEHIHEHEDEIFYIVSGTAKVVDNGVEKVVYAGDSIITGNGGSHSIENIGIDNLVVFAAIVTY